MADAGQPGNPRFEARSRSLGCLILAVLAIIVVAIVIALGWRSMWWRDNVPQQPQSGLPELLVEGAPGRPADQIVWRTSWRARSVSSSA